MAASGHARRRGQDRDDLFWHTRHRVSDAGATLLETGSMELRRGCPPHARVVHGGRGRGLEPDIVLLVVDLQCVSVNRIHSRVRGDILQLQVLQRAPAHPKKRSYPLP